MIAAVGDGGRGQGQAEPEEGQADVRAHEEGPHERRQQVGQDVFQGVGVDGADTDGCLVLVVDLVDVLVEVRVVEEPGKVELHVHVSVHKGSHVFVQ